MARKRSAGGTPATLVLQRAGVAYETHSYSHDPTAESYGLEAARALEVEPARVFKTLLVSTDKGLGVGVVPVDRTLDLKAVADALGVKKATMAEAALAERATGYVVGGISPIGQRTKLPTVVDESANSFETILVSGGKRGFDLALRPLDLLHVTSASTARIAR